MSIPSLHSSFSPPATTSAPSLGLQPAPWGHFRHVMTLVEAGIHFNSLMVKVASLNTIRAHHKHGQGEKPLLLLCPKVRFRKVGTLDVPYCEDLVPDTHNVHEVYDPTHPGADAQGRVHVVKINPEELISNAQIGTKIIDILVKMKEMMTTMIYKLFKSIE